MVDAVEPRIQEQLAACPSMPVTVIAERVGWAHAIRVRTTDAPWPLVLLVVDGWPKFVGSTSNKAAATRSTPWSVSCVRGLPPA